MRRTAAIAALLALGSCATPPAGPAPAPAPAPVAEAPRPPPPRPDQCGAYQLQHLVGRSRSEIPIPLYPERQRVACTTCPVTEDLRPDRLNFFFDAGTGLIREIRCG
jgi:hypothetical protein